MNISIFGLGYVGSVLSACLAREGHHIIGVDVDPDKVALINQGKSPIIETGLEELLADGLAAGRIRATTDPHQAILDTDLSMACVGTPSGRHGDLDLKFVRRVCENFGRGIREKQPRHLFVFRSTMLPGTIRGTVIPLLEEFSGKQAGADFGVAINPEFMRESTAVQDFYHPPKTVIGALQDGDADTLAALYAGLPGPMIKTRIETAEMVKYVDNVFHALKITYANEIGTICRSLGVDGHEVMNIFCQDQKLNISPAYLKPGFAFGGSCLPKDLRALGRLARNHELTTPLLTAILTSNEQQIHDAFELIQQRGRMKIGLLGFAFKAGTDDLRESPFVTLAELLLGKGYDLRLYDPSVSLARLVGANRRYIAERIPHISRLMVDSAAELVQHADLIVLGHQNAEFEAVLSNLEAAKAVLDLTSRPAPRPRPPGYERLCG